MLCLLCIFLSDIFLSRKTVSYFWRRLKLATPHIRRHSREESGIHLTLIVTVFACCPSAINLISTSPRPIRLRGICRLI